MEHWKKKFREGLAAAYPAGGEGLADGFPTGEFFRGVSILVEAAVPDVLAILRRDGRVVAGGEPELQAAELIVRILLQSSEFLFETAKWAFGAAGRLPYTPEASRMRVRSLLLGLRPEREIIEVVQTHAQPSSAMPSHREALDAVLRALSRPLP